MSNIKEKSVCHAKQFDLICLGTRILVKGTHFSTWAHQHLSALPALFHLIMAEASPPECVHSQPMTSRSELLGESHFFVHPFVR